jgi:hypothetical protein
MDTLLGTARNRRVKSGLYHVDRPFASHATTAVLPSHGALFRLPCGRHAPSRLGKHYYWEIVLPGSIVGLLVGYATQRWGAESTRTA